VAATVELTGPTQVGRPPVAELADTLENLLRSTLRYVAEEVPFYRDRIAQPGRSSSLGLIDFPLIDRTTVHEHFFDFLVPHHFPDYLIMSGGTTGSVLNATFRNEEEIEAVQQFLNGTSSHTPPALSDIEAFGVDVFFNTNGYTRRKPRGCPLVSIPLERQAHADLITRLLVHGLLLDGRVIPARYLQSQNGLHRVLAGYYLVTGTDPRDFAIDSVFGYGQHLSRLWNRRLEELWGMQVTSTYGLSEFAGANALRCDECGALHYLTAWQEFLSPTDHVPVEAGDALLVLTSLIPFVAIQPRIRYITGDLVSIQRRCASTGLIGFEFRGRMTSSAWESCQGRTQVAFSEIDIVEALDQLRDVNTRRHPAEIQLWEDGDLPEPPFSLGFPQFVLDARDFAVSKTATLVVEVTFDPSADTSRAEVFKGELFSLMYAECGPLGSRIESGEVDLRIALRSPRSLRLPQKTTG
jgi:hypothetical protein